MNRASRAQITAGPRPGQPCVPRPASHEHREWTEVVFPCSRAGGPPSSCTRPTTFRGDRRPSVHPRRRPGVDALATEPVLVDDLTASDARLTVAGRHSCPRSQVPGAKRYSRSRSSSARLPWGCSTSTGAPRAPLDDDAGHPRAAGSSAMGSSLLAPTPRKDPTDYPMTVHRAAGMVMVQLTTPSRRPGSAPRRGVPGGYPGVRRDRGPRGTEEIRAGGKMTRARKSATERDARLAATLRDPRRHPCRRLRPRRAAGPAGRTLRRLAATCTQSGSCPGPRRHSSRSPRRARRPGCSSSSSCRTTKARASSA